MVDEVQGISILYVEDHAIVREAITQFLNLQPDMRVVREVHAGKQPTLSAEVSSRLAARGMNAPLTRRERDVVELIAAGMRNKEIASTLGISEETVHGYIKNVFTKLQVNDRAAAVTTAVRRGIIHLR